MESTSKLIWTDGNTAKDYDKIMQNDNCPKHLATLKVDKKNFHSEFEIEEDLIHGRNMVEGRYTCGFINESPETGTIRIGSADDLLNHGQANFINRVNQKLLEFMKYEGQEITADDSDLLLWEEPKHNIRYSNYDVENHHKIHLASLTAYGNRYTAELTVQEENFHENPDRSVTYNMTLKETGADDVSYTGMIGSSKDVLNEGIDRFVDRVNKRLVQALSWEGIIVSPTMPDKTKFQYLPQKKNSRENSLEAQIHLTENNETEPEKD